MEVISELYSYAEDPEISVQNCVFGSNAISANS